MKRRVFLGAGLGAALARAADQPVGVGVIGVGNRGAHVLGLVLQQPDVKVTALCDLKPDRLDKAASAAAKHNPATMTDYRKLIERPDVNAIFIESPCDLHVEMAIAALKAGKHIYCEKPVNGCLHSSKAFVEVRLLIVPCFNMCLSADTPVACALLPTTCNKENSEP